MRETARAEGRPPRYDGRWRDRDPATAPAGVKPVIRLRAPQDGWVTRRNVYLGNYLTAGQNLFSLVSPDVWVTANFKENQLDRMRPGQSVQLKVDAYPHLKLQGHVDSVQMGSGSKFSAFPAENATGNFIKIVQRVPVKLVLDSGMDPNIPLPLGLSVVPTVQVDK